MAGLGIPFELRLLDRQSIKYEAMAQKVGRDAASLAFARALNHEGAKALTGVRKDMRDATSIRYGDISKGVKGLVAWKTRLHYVIEGTDRPIPLGNFAGAKQGKKGTSVKVWGKRQLHRRAFILASAGRGIFKNTRGFNSKSGRYNAIQTLFGPSIPDEMLKPSVTENFHKHGEGVHKRARTELDRILNSL